jgi:hypothetical protein
VLRFPDTNTQLRYALHVYSFFKNKQITKKHTDEGFIFLFSTTVQDYLLLIHLVVTMQLKNGYNCPGLTPPNKFGSHDAAKKWLQLSRINSP